MSPDLARLREVAEGATPGPWGRAATDGMGWAVHRGEHKTVALYADRENAQHIATFDPPTVIALLDRLAEQEFHIRQLTESRDRAERAAEKAEAAVERVRALAYMSDDGSEYEHNEGCQGEAECPACWALSIRAALDPQQATDSALRGQDGDGGAVSVSASTDDGKRAQTGGDA